MSAVPRVIGFALAVGAVWWQMSHDLPLLPYALGIAAATGCRMLARGEA